MYMNLKPNNHKRISFNITTMTSLGFIAPTPKHFRSPFKFSSPPPNNFYLKFLGPPKIRGAATMLYMFLEKYEIISSHDFLSLS